MLPFGVGVSGVYFSDTSGASWMQPTYQGFTARDCLGVVGTQPANPSDNCDPHYPGPIGTLPQYYENGLVSDGDPAVAFGPRRASNGSFSWSNGWRLYYANLTSNVGADRSEFAFKGFEAIAVSRLDSENYPAAKSPNPVIASAAWSAPVIVSQAERGPLLRPRADRRRRRAGHEPVLRQRLHLRRSLPRSGEGERSAGADRRQLLERRRRHVEPDAAVCGNEQRPGVRPPGLPGEHRQQGDRVRLLAGRRPAD